MHFDMLFVGEKTHVMLNLELMLGLTMLALDRLNDSAALNEPFFLVVAICAQKGSLFHLRDNVAIADDDATQGDHLVNVLGTKLTDAVGLAEVVRTDLDEDILLLFVGTNDLLPSEIIHIKLFVDLGYNKIEDRDQVSGVILNLAVQLRVERVDVTAVNIKHL